MVGVIIVERTMKIFKPEEEAAKYSKFLIYTVVSIGGLLFCLAGMYFIQTILLLKRKGTSPQLKKLALHRYILHFILFWIVLGITIIGALNVQLNHYLAKTILGVDDLKEYLK